MDHGLEFQALQTYVLSGDVLAVQEILHSRPSLVNFQDLGAGCSESLLHIVVRTGSDEMFRLLLLAGADVNTPNLSGQTPLHAAISSTGGRGYLAAQLLIERGADVFAMDDFGSTALDQAVILNNREAELLLRRAMGLTEAGPLPPRMGETPLPAADLIEKRAAAAAAVAGNVRHRAGRVIEDPASPSSSSSPDHAGQRKDNDDGKPYSKVYLNQSGTLLLKLSSSITNRETHDIGPAPAEDRKTKSMKHGARMQQLKEMNAKVKPNFVDEDDPEYVRMRMGLGASEIGQVDIQGLMAEKRKEAAEEQQKRRAELAQKETDLAAARMKAFFEKKEAQTKLDKEKAALVQTPQRKKYDLSKMERAMEDEAFFDDQSSSSDDEMQFGQDRPRRLSIQERTDKLKAADGGKVGDFGASDAKAHSRALKKAAKEARFAAAKEEELQIQQQRLRESATLSPTLSPAKATSISGTRSDAEVAEQRAARSEDKKRSAVDSKREDDLFKAMESRQAAAPPVVSVTSATQTSINLSWAEASSPLMKTAAGFCVLVATRKIERGCAVPAGNELNASQCTTEGDYAEISKVWKEWSTTISDLEPGTGYAFRLQAMFGINAESASTGGAMGPPSDFYFTHSVPGMPESVSMKAQTDASVTVDWSATVRHLFTGGVPITGFTVFCYQDVKLGDAKLAVKKDNAHGRQLASESTHALPAETANSFTVPGLKPGNVYRIQLRATNSYGDGPFSPPLKVKTHCSPKACAAPLLDEVANSKIHLAWQPPEDNGGSPVTNYYLYVATVQDKVMQVRSEGQLDGLEWNEECCLADYQSTASVDTDYPEERERATFYFRIAAENRYGVGPVSASTVALYGHVAPLQPCHPLVVVSCRGDSIGLEWSQFNPLNPSLAAVPPISHWEVEMAVLESTTVTVQRRRGGLSTASLFAEGGTGNTKASDGWTWSDMEAVESWTAPRATVAALEQLISGVVAPIDFDAESHGLSVKPYCRVNGLKEGTTYRFRVRAVNPVGAGPWGEAGEGVVVEAPTTEYKCLILANSEYYERGFIHGCLEQADQISKVMEKGGFDVTLLKNVSSKHIPRSEESFMKTVDQWCVVTVIYIGMTLSTEEDDNLFVPLDAEVKVTSSEEFLGRCFSAKSFASRLQVVGTLGHFVAMLSMQPKHPFPSKLLGSCTTRISALRAESNMMVLVCCHSSTMVRTNSVAENTANDMDGGWESKGGEMGLLVTMLNCLQEAPLNTSEENGKQHLNMGEVLWNVYDALWADVQVGACSWSPMLSVNGRPMC